MHIVIGLMLAFILLAVFSNRGMRQCRWRAHRRTEDVLWRCAFCGAETVRPPDAKPDMCLRDNS